MILGRPVRMVWEIECCSMIADDGDGNDGFVTGKWHACMVQM